MTPMVMASEFSIQAQVRVINPTMVHILKGNSGRTHNQGSLNTHPAIGATTCAISEQFGSGGSASGDTDSTDAMRAGARSQGANLFMADKWPQQRQYSRPVRTPPYAGFSLA
jgi:hypothetical protein